MIGLALYVIGYVGVFFANLIKAAVSRQREFLADASAVQFTRNPDGIAGALKKIGRIWPGSTIREPRAAEASHMFFGNAGGAGQLFGLLETHPPLVERIRRLDPSFDGDFSKVRLDCPADAPARGSPAAMRQPRARSFSFNPAEAVARVGTIGAPHLLYAAGLLEDLPADYPRNSGPAGSTGHGFRDVARPGGRRLPAAACVARPVCASGRGAADAARCCPKSGSLPRRSGCLWWRWLFRRLRQMTPAQMRDFLAGVKALVEADNKLTIFEYALQRLLLRHLVAYFVKRPAHPPQYTSYEPLVEPVNVGALGAGSGRQSSPEAAAAAFAAGVQALSWPAARFELSPEGSTDLIQLDARLAHARPGKPAAQEDRSCWRARRPWVRMAG